MKIILLLTYYMTILVCFLASHVIYINNKYYNFLQIYCRAYLFLFIEKYIAKSQRNKIVLGKIRFCKMIYQTILNIFGL